MEAITNRIKPRDNSKNISFSYKGEQQQAEFLDEQEQEQLLQDLRQQNEQSNFIIQGGLLLIGILVCAIFLVYFYEVYNSADTITRTPKAMLPLRFLSKPVISQVKLPYLGVLLSIGSVAASISTLILTCRVTLHDFVRMTPSHRGMGPQLHRLTSTAAVISGVMTPLLCLCNSHVTWIEVSFWSLPLATFVMYTFAISMMWQVEANFTELEKSRYKYKGA